MSPPSNRITVNPTREVSATRSKKGHKLTRKWQGAGMTGAGMTIGTIAGKAAKDGILGAK